jgi:hypothetical protein
MKLPAEASFGVCEDEDAVGTCLLRTRKQLSPRVVKPDLAGVLLRHYNLSLTNRIVNVLLNQVLAQVMIAQSIRTRNSEEKSAPSF